MAYIHALLSPKMWKERRKGLKNTQEDYGFLIGTYLNRCRFYQCHEIMSIPDELRFQRVTLVTAASDICKQVCLTLYFAMSTTM